MENIIFRAEALLRFLALVSAVLAGCLVALDKQTKTVFLSLQRTATYKDLRALEVVVIIEAVVAAYQFVQLVKCLICAKSGAISSWCKLCSRWVCFLLDQNIFVLKEDEDEDEDEDGQVSHRNLVFETLDASTWIFALDGDISTFFNSFLLMLLSLFGFATEMAAYISLGGTSAAVQACFFAMTGLEAFQWTKLCNVYTRFCYSVGGGLLCGMAAALFAAAVASISAFHLFRLFSPNKWFTLKQGRGIREVVAKS